MLPDVFDATSQMAALMLLLEYEEGLRGCKEYRCHIVVRGLHEYLLGTTCILGL